MRGILPFAFTVQQVCAILQPDYHEQSGKRAHVLDQFRTLEKDVFSLYRDISSYKSGGVELTWYELEAKKQVENGNYAGAIAILQDKQRKKDLDQAILLTDTGIEKIEAHIRENELLIKTLKAQRKTSKTVDEIDRCYHESAELTQKYHLKNNVLFDYANFLVINKGDYEKVIEIASNLLGQTHEEDVETLADIYQLIGENYLNNAHRLSEGQKYYTKSIEFYEQTKDSFKKYQNIIFSYHRVYQMYRIEENYDMQHHVCKTLLDINENHRIYISDYYLASTNELYGEYHSAVGHIQKAEVCFSKALRIFSGLSDICPDAFASNLAKINLSYAKLMMEVKDREKVEQFCRKAIEGYTDLEKMAPVVYGDELADAYDTYVAIRRI